MRRVVYAPDRLTHPLLAAGPRGSGRFREASWEEALRLVAGRLADIRDRHGPQAVLSLGGSGSCRGAQHNTGLLAAHSRWTYPEFVDTLNCTRGSVSGGYPNTTCLPKMRYAELGIVHSMPSRRLCRADWDWKTGVFALALAASSSASRVTSWTGLSMRQQASWLRENVESVNRLTGRSTSSVMTRRTSTRHSQTPHSALRKARS